MNKLVEALEKRMRGTLPPLPFIAIVKTAPPNISIEYLGNIIKAEQIKIMNYLLLNYHRTYKLKGVIDKQHQDVSEQKQTFSASDMSPAGEGPHKHNLVSGTSNGTIESTGNYEHHGDLWLTDTLRVGCEVLVQVVGNSYIITGQVVQMPNSAKEGA
ncbi:MAG: DUF2577 family protein [Fusobacteriaceae bacterium]